MTKSDSTKKPVQNASKPKKKPKVVSSPKIIKFKPGNDLATKVK